MQKKQAARLICSMIVGLAVCAQDGPAPLDVPTVSARLDGPRRLLAQGETFEAIRALRKIEAANPRDGETVLLLAYGYWLAGQKSLFALKARQAAGLLPRSHAPHYALGRYLLDVEGNAAEAAIEFEQALARDPAHGASLYHLGWCRELDQRLDEAEKLYTRVGIWLGKAGLARLALARGDLDAAVAQAKAAVLLAPRQAQAQALLARIHERRAEYAAAIAAYQSAIGADPTDARLHYQLAQCARQAGQPELYRKSLERYNELRSIYAPE